MRCPLTTTALLSTLAFLASSISAQAGCDLPVRPPVPDENGQMPEPEFAGPRQAEGSLQYDRENDEFVKCVDGLWVPQKSFRDRG